MIETILADLNAKGWYINTAFCRDNGLQWTVNLWNGTHFTMHAHAPDLETALLISTDLISWSQPLPEQILTCVIENSPAEFLDKFIASLQPKTDFKRRNLS